MWSGSAVEQALSEVLQTPPASLAWTAEGVSIDSRTLVAGDLFIALRGSNFDGNQYLTAAHQAQATAAIAETLPSGSARALPVFQVKDGLAGLIALAETARDSSSALRPRCHRIQRQNQLAETSNPSFNSARDNPRRREKP